MKALKVLKFAIPALVLVSATAMAGVVGSSHDLSTTNSGDQGQVCVYCHTPHASLGATNGPLWNHNQAATVTSYTMYDSLTLNTTPDATPGAESLACLSCHDGTIALDNISNIPGLDATWTTEGGNMTGTTLVGTVTAGDLDLSNDHPIAFTYDAALVLADGGLEDVATATGAGVVLFGGQVECATCHDVHDDLNNAFLRVTDLGSAICTACHAK